MVLRWTLTYAESTFWTSGHLEVVCRVFLRFTSTCQLRRDTGWQIPVGRVPGGFNNPLGATWGQRSKKSGFVGPPPLRGSFFLENGTLCDTREKNLSYRIQKRDPKKRHYALFYSS